PIVLHREGECPLAVAPILPVWILEGARHSEAPPPGPPATTRSSGLRGRACRLGHGRRPHPAGRTRVGDVTGVLRRRQSPCVDRLGEARGVAPAGASRARLCHSPPLLRVRLPRRRGEVLREVARTGRPPVEFREGGGRLGVNPWLERIYRHSPIALQNLYVSWYGRRIRRERFNRAFDDWMGLFERSQWWGPEDLGTHQDQALAGLVAHCYETVPFYRKVMEERGLRPADVATRHDLHKLPIVTKDTIRGNPTAFLARGLKTRALKESPTSGTTGASFSVFWDSDTDVLWNA